MIALRFDRARMAELIDCLDTGKPIKSRRTAFDYLMLAGAAQAAALSQGPHTLRRDGPAGMSEEYREAQEVGFEESLVAAVKLCAMLSFQIIDGRYELPENFGAVIRQIDGVAQVQVVK